MKKKLLLIFMILFLLPFPGISKSFKVSFFSPKSFYIYATGSWISNIRSDYHNIWEGCREKSNGFVPFLGVGYTILNVEKSIRVNLEFDYASANFNFLSTSGRRIDLYTLMVNVEFRISSRLPFSLYSGFGLSGIDYSRNPTIYFDDYNIVPRSDPEVRVPICFGLKISLTKHLLLRAEARNYTYNVGEEGHYYYVDDSPVSFDFGSESHFGSTLAFGLEYHF